MIVGDYSAVLDPEEVARHYQGVVRYLGRYTPKVLRLEERDRLHALGVSIALVYEDDGILDGGAALGAAHAARASQQLAEREWPIGRACYFANDDNYYPHVSGAHLDYMRAARDVLAPRPVGAYGDAAFLDACRDRLGITYLWHVSTWGPKPAGTVLQQEANWPPPMARTDVNSVWADDWGQHPYALGEAPDHREAALLLWNT